MNGTRLDELKGDRFKDSGVPGVQNVQVEGFGGWTFAQLVFYMEQLHELDIAPDHTNKWHDISAKVGAAKGKFHGEVTKWLQPPDGAEGDTAKAVWKNITSSLNVPDSLATDAERMSIIVDAFSRCITQTRQQLAANRDAYDKIGPTDTSSREPYNQFARGLMASVYAPGIETVAANHPNSARDAPPSITSVSVPDGPGGPSSAGPSSLSPSGVPSIPSIPSIPSKPSVPSKPSTPSPADPSKGLGDAAKGVGDAAKGVGDAANSAGDAAKDAAGKATDALNQALGSLGSQPPDGLNPDKLSGLGGVPVGGLGQTGTTRGGPGGASGAGVGPTNPKTAANPALASSPIKATAAAPVSRAGISAQGSPGAAGGAPAAGARQGGAAGAVHKVNKALNNRKNGSEIVGQADAVVAVVGDEAAPEQATKPVPSKP